MKTTIAIACLFAMSVATNTCDYDETLNLDGPHVCADDHDCTGARTCSPNNMCMGVSSCNEGPDPIPSLEL